MKKEIDTDQFYHYSFTQEMLDEQRRRNKEMNDYLDSKCKDIFPNYVLARQLQSKNEK